MVLGKVLNYVVRETGARLIPAAYRAFRRYDIQTTNALFGKSGGKGFRHGRDLGLILGEYVGDDVNDELQTTYVKPPTGKVRKTYRGYKRGYNRRSTKYDRCNPKYFKRRSN